MYKDLAKWLIGFVPVATLLSLAVAIAPAAAQIDAHGPHGVTLVAAVLVLLAMVAMLGTCSHVLLAGPSTWEDLSKNKVWMSQAFSTYSVGRPYFLDSTSFSEAELECVPHPADPRGPFVKEVTAQIVALSADLNAKKRFTRFLWVFVIGSLIIVGGVLAVLISTSGAKHAYAEPTAVSLHVPPSATTSFVEATGCSSPSTTEAVAVGGTGGDPELRLFGPGCHGTSWSPPSSLGILVTTR